MTIRYYISIAAMALFFLDAGASTVDTVSVPSAAMQKTIKTVVITPDAYRDSLPVVYLLHGYSGDYGDWVNASRPSRNWPIVTG